MESEPIDRRFSVGLLLLGFVFLARSIWLWSTGAAGGPLREAFGDVLAHVVFILLAGTPLTRGRRVTLVLSWAAIILMAVAFVLVPW